jgi:hypothetical protein
MFIKSSKGSSALRTRAAKIRQRPRRHPVLELLEDRSLPSVGFVEPPLVSNIAGIGRRGGRPLMRADRAGGKPNGSGGQ